MAFYLLAFGLLLHVLAWGAGLALWITPRRWKPYWPIFAGICGLTLQTTVVWLGAYLDFRGTHAYGLASEGVPVALLVLAMWRHGRPLGKSTGAPVLRFAGLWLLMAVVLAVLILPFAEASKTLTSFSLGSCDAADYAAGARVLAEFAHSSREGFIGLKEVVQLLSVDNFFDHWLRLNHFTPSALVALNGAIFGREPYEIISVMTAVFLVLTLPMVYWLCRAVLRYGARTSGFVTVLYGVSPLTWYAVYHVAMSQLLAANAVALLTICGVVWWERRATVRAGREFIGLLVVAFAMVFSAYNFIVVVCLVPACAYVVGRAIWGGRYAAAVRWVGGMVLAGTVAGLIYADRVLGLVERFRLFRQFDFGWRIAPLSPEGWLGMVQDVGLHGINAPWLRWSLAGIAVCLLLFALARRALERSRQAYVAVAFLAPVLIGYGLLLARGVIYETNASYDAYKLFSVFQPELLAALCFWLVLMKEPWRVVRVIAVVFGFTVVGFNAVGAYRFVQRMRVPPLIVDRALIDLQKIERMPEVSSVNVLIPDFWSRLWANSFLLRKPQYFLTHSYEGRLNTALKGEWDLVGGVIQIHSAEQSSGQPKLAPPFSLLDTRAPTTLRVTFAQGWHDPERSPKGGARWAWSRGDASLEIKNLHEQPLRATISLVMRSLVNRNLQFWFNGKQVHASAVGTQVSTIELPGLLVPPGQSELEVRSDLPALAPGQGDLRKLGIAAYEIQVVVSRDLGDRASGATPRQ